MYTFNLGAEIFDEDLFTVYLSIMLTTKRTNAPFAIKKT